MKKLALLLLVSVLGGIITLGSYKYFLEEDPAVLTVAEPVPEFTPVNFRPGSPNNVDFTEAARKTVHAVVHVKNMAVTRSPFMRRDGIALQGTGSGVIISPDGYIVTNHHVIKNASELQVTTNDNKTYIAEVIGADPKTDIALLKIDAEGLDYLPFGNSNNVEIG
ncbi:MAG TPA: trypsin-like peptidase domain-containing protein, partial [Salinimicrobium sp.]|nr:trypsin-like peptidase domain-containing protein [Salinimicrobium sp.]